MFEYEASWDYYTILVVLSRRNKTGLFKLYYCNTKLLNSSPIGAKAPVCLYCSFKAFVVSRSCYK